MYAISKNVPQSIVAQLRAEFPPKSIGCLAEILPLSLLESTPPLPYSLSVATYTPPAGSTTTAIEFRSTLAGRPNVTVGREIKAGPRLEDFGADIGVGETIDTGFEKFLKGEKWGFGEAPGMGRRAQIPELASLDPNSVKQLLFFSADRTQPFLTALSNYEDSTTLGMISSSTPFHTATGAPFSLFKDGGSYSTGAVGIAIIEKAESNTPSSNATREVKVDYAGMEVFGESMEVTAAKGNIVVELSGQNAARTLLKAVQDLPSSIKGVAEAARLGTDRSAEKDKEYFAAIFNAEDRDSLNDLSKARHVSQIMAGDPSRGAMSVDTEEEVQVGYWISFLHRPTSQSTLSKLITTTSSSPTALSFLSTASSDHELSLPTTKPITSSEEATTKTLDGFFVASENGVVLSRIGKGSWVCTAEGATGVLEG